LISSVIIDTEFMGQKAARCGQAWLPF
jgi:hypothetical protein